MSIVLRMRNLVLQPQTCSFPSVQEWMMVRGVNIWWGTSLMAQCLRDFSSGSVSKESACIAGDPGSIPGLEIGETVREINRSHVWLFWVSYSLSIDVVIICLSLVHPFLEKETATHSSILAQEIPMDRGAWWATVHGVVRVRHNLATKPPPTVVKNLPRNARDTGLTPG